MNTDVNLAAWLIAGGPAIDDPAEERAREHRRALAVAAAGRALAARATTAMNWRGPAPAARTLTATTTGSQIRIDTACCAA